jgi:hemerythrin-like domain-containing protein
MKVIKILRSEQEIIDRFLAIFGLGAVRAAQSRPVQPSYFLYGYNFIQGYIEAGYFKKEEVLLKLLEDSGLEADSGPLGHMFSEIKQTHELSAEIVSAARQWQGGDPEGRNNIVWSTTSYTSMMRQHFERSRNIIFPLAEQLIPPDDEYKIAEAFNRIVFDGAEAPPPEHYEKIIKDLELEAAEWN